MVKPSVHSQSHGSGLELWQIEPLVSWTACRFSVEDVTGPKREWTARSSAANMLDSVGHFGAETGRMSR